MAKTKTAKNMLQNRDEYARFFQGFRGVDFSSDHTEVIDQRFAYLVNMYKDYKSGEGGAIETIPGYRRVYEGQTKIFGLYEYKDYLIAHVNTELRIIGYKNLQLQEMKYIENEGFYLWLPTDDHHGIESEDLPVPYNLISKFEIRYPEGENVWKEYEVGYLENEETGIVTVFPVGLDVFLYGTEVRIYLKPITDKMYRQKSTSLIFNDRLYILDGVNFYEFYLAKGKTAVIRNVVDSAYIPTTHKLIYPGTNDSILAPGVEIDQRNILTPKYKNTFIAGTKSTVDLEKLEGYHGNEFQLKYGSDYEIKVTVDNATTDVVFPKGITVYQYGVKLPLAVLKDDTETSTFVVPKGFPNAILSVTKDGLVTLLASPPAPDYNTWNPNKKEFDYTEDEIKNNKVPERYTWPWAFSEGYDGIEIMAENAITNINGIEAKGGHASIITKCTIATIFDNRLFLSGNPDFPTHIFWSGLNGETTYPDPTYFGITNNDIEGVTNSPVTAMLPVADQLMVLKKENASEGSVIFHTPTIGSDNVMPKIYPSTQGLPGRGCLGAACNFLDDPVFVSRLGLEAMGSYTNAKYERSIEHRSSLIDSKLLSCDLSKAQLIEYDGYLLLLADGKIFMADSRQTFTHQTGVMQYEWYYLEDIGVWEGQFDEYVYAMLPGETGDAVFPDSLMGAPLLEATAVRNNLGIEENLIGKTASEENGDIIHDEIVRDNVYYDFYFKRIMRRDEYGRETNFTDCYYVEPTGAKCGGTFIPAERLYVIGSDLYFSAGRFLCKFNFDKRDSNTGIVPVEYYNFDGRRIFSGCATKMDNCGIPHLTKNTVKRSTVIKTRTFTHSNAKIKVRTNRQTFKQVGRIISGHEVFEGLDFADFTFSPEGNTLFSINEKEKKWVEKQHFIYSDEYCKPFALYYLVYRYNVAGRYKDH